MSKDIATIERAADIAEQFQQLDDLTQKAYEISVDILGKIIKNKEGQEGEAGIQEQSVYRQTGVR